MPDFLGVEARQNAIVLADELNYERAADKLHISSAELKTQISALEAKLSVQIFKSKRTNVELSDRGRVLIKFFRQSVAVHDRIAAKSVDGGS